MNFYNDNDPYVVQWLKNLIAAGHIAPGLVSGESIVNLSPPFLEKYHRCHFFAGIAGWEYALKLAGWPEDIPVWTGSCPCQPFSVAGKRKGESDDRHLWPYFARLIEACGPPVVFGEQVASKDGRLWLAGVQADLEGMGYQFAAADLCAAGVGAPHIRQRLYWVAYAGQFRSGIESKPHARSEAAACVSGSGEAHRLAYSERDTGGEGRSAKQSGESIGAQSAGPSVEPGRRSDVSGLDYSNSQGQGQQQATDDNNGSISHRADADRPGDVSGLGYAFDPGLEGFTGPGNDRDQSGRQHSHAARPVAETSWSDYRLIRCADGKTRRIGSGVQPLAHGVPARVGKLRAYGNAIVPQVAAEFIKSFMEVIEL